LDDLNRVNVLHVRTGELNQIAALPTSASITGLAVAPNHVYFLDRAGRTLYVLTISTEQLATVALPFAASVSALSGSADERLWMATTVVGLASYDPRTNRLETVSAAGLDLSAVATDSLGRVWTAGKQRQALDLYDPLSGKITELSLSHTGAVTTLAVDRADAVWVGTDTGQALALRMPAGAGASLVASSAVGRPISSFVLDQNGAMYFVARDVNGVVYGGVRVPAVTQSAPASASEPMFDSLGRAWQADRLAGGFYVTLPGARP
jgi:streptogramin lyase